MTSTTLSGQSSIDTDQAAGEYLLVAYATDQYGAQTEKNIAVTLADNIPPTALPIADAGQSQSINTGTVVQLDGTSSYDDDGDQLTYIWTLDSKPFISFASLNDATTATPNIRVDKAGEYLISLIVNDGKEDSAPSTIKLTVVQAVNPIAENIDIMIFAGAKYYGFSGSNYTEVLQSYISSCISVSGLDINEKGILYSVSTRASTGIKIVDPNQPLCLKVGTQPTEMHGVAIDDNGELWGTSGLSYVDDNQLTKLYHFNTSGELIKELNLSGDEDVIFGIDFSSNGNLYGFGFTSRKLVKIDTGTGVTTYVATITPNIHVHDIDIDSTDVLRVLDDKTGDLYELNLNGEQLSKTNIPSLCTSCGWVSIATNK